LEVVYLKETSEKKPIICFKCKKNIAGKSEVISFTYNNLKVTVLKDGMTCAKCEERRWIEDFERNGKKLIRLEKGRVKVDWPLYSEAYSKDEASKLTSILISLGILSLDARKCWSIVGSGEIGLNPRHLGTYLYFSREEDAVSFAFLNHADTTYAWEIRYISEVLSKEKVLRRAVRYFSKF
jgi:hypothetical protein